MKRKRHATEEVIRKLRTAEEAMAGGRTVEEACRIMAVSMATFQRWIGRYSGVKTDTTTADRIHRWAIGHPPNPRLHAWTPLDLPSAPRSPILNPESQTNPNPKNQPTTKDFHKKWSNFRGHSAI